MNRSFVLLALLAGCEGKTFTVGWLANTQNIVGDLAVIEPGSEACARLPDLELTISAWETRGSASPQSLGEETVLPCVDDTPVGFIGSPRARVGAVAAFEGHPTMAAGEAWGEPWDFTGVGVADIDRHVVIEVRLPTEVDCTGGEDDDADGLVDCDDPDCEFGLGCYEAHETSCVDGDDDMDGLADCEDPDCATDPACPEVDCDDGLDNDGDGDVDCDDTSCALAAPCWEVHETSCVDGDDDYDGLADCDDPDCATDPVCLPTTPTTSAECDPLIVISGVYTLGGEELTSWSNDFVEIANRTSTNVILSGFWLHVAGSDQVWSVIDLSSLIVPADGFVLVQLGGVFSFPNNLITYDLRQYGIPTNLSSTGSAVVLSTSSTPAATGTCPAAADVVDAVGLYQSTFCPEGYPILQGVTGNQGFRRADPCDDTDANSADFAVTAITAPRTSADVHPACVCP